MKKFKYIIDGKEYIVEIGNIVGNIAQVIVSGENFNVELEAESEPEKKSVLSKLVANEPEEESQLVTNVNTDHAAKAPLSGVITDILVHINDEVKAGDTVVVLEATKMVNNVGAEKDGKVMIVCTKQDEGVIEDTPLVVIE